MDKINSEFDDDHAMDQILNNMVYDIMEPYMVFLLNHKDLSHPEYLGTFTETSFEFACVTAIETYRLADQHYDPSDDCYWDLSFHQTYDRANKVAIHRQLLTSFKK